jgi:hypothetical protein
MRFFFTILLAFICFTGLAQLTTSSLLFNENRAITSARNWAIRQNNGAEGDLQFGFVNTNTGGLPNFFTNPGDAKFTITSTGDVRTSNKFSINSVGAFDKGASGIRIWSNQNLVLSAGGGSPDYFTLLANGNIGIGSISPFAKLEILSDNYLMRFRGTQVSTNTPFDIMNLGLSGPTGAMNVSFRLGFPYQSGVNNGPKVDLIKMLNGYTVLGTSETGTSLSNVLIGKTTQSNSVYKLDVNGSVRANEIVVNTTGADFVFQEDYCLRPLSEVAAFIKSNKHLPEIASADEMQANGVAVSELQTKLLQKVE